MIDGFFDHPQATPDILFFVLAGKQDRLAVDCALTKLSKISGIPSAERQDGKVSQIRLRRDEDARYNKLMPEIRIALGYN